MENEEIFSKLRTDLAYDESVRHCGEKIEGLNETTMQVEGFKVICQEIKGNCSEQFNKKPGIYYTIDLSDCSYHDTMTCEKVEKALYKVLNNLLEIMNLKNKKCLLVGLGNINVTPDALGPFVLDNVIVTRHLFELNNISEGFSEVSAISPGVMGVTGIESFEIIQGIKEKIDIDFIIVIDALCSNSIRRINKTIQITDTGISPGSGVGNKRKELSIDTIGVPVIAIGVPTVVDVSTITVDTMDMLLKYLDKKINGNVTSVEKLSSIEKGINFDKEKDPLDEHKEMFLGKIGLLNSDERRSIFKEILDPSGFNMIVTPKEIDQDVEELAKIIATGINFTLHDGLLKHQTE